MGGIAGGGVGIKEITCQPHLCRISSQGIIRFGAQRKRVVMMHQPETFLRQMVDPAA
jgi:hypothetical protein